MIYEQFENFVRAIATVGKGNTFYKRNGAISITIRAIMGDVSFMELACFVDFTQNKDRVFAEVGDDKVLLDVTALTPTKTWEVLVDHWATKYIGLYPDSTNLQINIPACYALVGLTMN